MLQMMVHLKQQMEELQENISRLKEEVRDYRVIVEDMILETQYIDNRVAGLLQEMVEIEK